jgi:hypothetical protein
MRRVMMGFLAMGVLAEKQWAEHLQSQGVDISQYPETDRELPGLGIVRQRVYPGALKQAFREWYREEFLPRLRKEVQA